MRLTLGAIPFYWPKQTILDFYQQAKDWPVDRIYLGETVCSKRREMRTDDWLALARELQAAGKEVVLSTLALLEAESELKTVNRLCQQDEFLVEANDLSAVESRFQQQAAFVGGPYLNVYNPQTLSLLHKDGLTGWCLPVELGKAELESMLAAVQAEKLPVQTEVMVHGYLPLALSARCFTARGLDKPKDQCERVCIDFPTGIPVDSQEDQRLFTMNGIQTLSGDILDLLSEVPDMQRLGVDAIRVVPSQFDMKAIVEAYANAINGNRTDSAPPSSAAYCNGYWFGKEGMAHIA